jgi:hypothetical protein
MAGLSPRQLELFNKFYSQYRGNADEFIDKYGNKAPKVMYGRAMKLAKNSLDKENKLKIKEMIKKSLTKPVEEEINSAAFVQTRKPVDDEKNPIDIVKMDIPLLIRMMEYAKEDAETDMDLHAAAENMIELSKEDRILSMDDYTNIISPDEEKQINELVNSVMAKLKR